MPGSAVICWFDPYLLHNSTCAGLLLALRRRQKRGAGCGAQWGRLGELAALDGVVEEWVDVCRLPEGAHSWEEFGVGALLSLRRLCNQN